MGDAERMTSAIQPPKLRFPWLNLVLFLLTVCTVLLFGAFFLEGVPESVLQHAWYVWPFLPEVFLRAGPYTLAVISILGAHEIGHYLACRYYRIPATLPFFLPGLFFGTFGAVIRIRGVIPHRKALFDIAVAGPVAGFLVALPFLIYAAAGAEPMPGTPQPGSLGLGDSLLTWCLMTLFHGRTDLQVGSLYVGAWFGILITGLNLFPVGQLDGGHMVYALSRRLHRTLSYTTLVLLLGVVLTTALREHRPSVYTIWCAILLWMRARHPRLLYETVPLGRTRKIISGFVLVIFLLCFLPSPFYFP
jgi:membrane-associated protease RseP (regulator of RpoE activity)